MTLSEIELVKPPRDEPAQSCAASVHSFIRISCVKHAGLCMWYSRPAACSMSLPNNKCFEFIGKLPSTLIELSWLRTKKSRLGLSALTSGPWPRRQNHHGIAARQGRTQARCKRFAEGQFRAGIGTRLATIVSPRLFHSRTRNHSCSCSRRKISEPSLSGGTTRYRAAAEQRPMMPQLRWGHGHVRSTEAAPCRL